MNKELIKKYKAEFEHWLNDGTLQVFCDTGKKWNTYPSENGMIDINWAMKEMPLIIINDEYVELRKALAEGKTIQWECIEDEWVDLPRDFEFNEESTKYHVDEYRIKPEEQHIKIGDYIYDIQKNKYHRIENVLDEKVETKLFRIYKSSINDCDYRLWKPKAGELVVMYSEDYSTGFTVTLWEENSKFIPVPFTGELPE